MENKKIKIDLDFLEDEGGDQDVKIIKGRECEEKKTKKEECPQCRAVNHNIKNNNNKELRQDLKINGWLGFFIFSIFLGGLINVVISFIYFYSYFESIITIILSGYAFYVGYLLSCKISGALKNAKILLYLYLFLNIITMLTYPEDGRFFSIIINIAWLIYLHNSKKIKNIYLN